MLNNQVIDLMMARLGERRAPSLRLKVVQELNGMIQMLDQGSVIPWFNMARATGNLTVGQDAIPTPTLFVREVEEGCFKVKNTNGAWKELRKLPIEKLEEADGYEPSFPEAYSLYGEEFILAPIPNVAYAYKIKIYTRTPEFIDNAAAVSNKWLLNFFNYTTFSALQVINRVHVHSNQLAQFLEPELQRATDNFWRAVEARENANTDPLLGNTEN